MRNSWCKRLIALVLAALTALSLSACGGKDGGHDIGQDISQGGGFGSGSESDQGNARSEDYVYVPKFTELENAEEADFINGLLMGDSLYYVSLQYHDGDERARQYIYEYSLSQERVLQETFVSDRGMNIDDFYVSSDGSIYTVLMEDQETSTDIEIVSMLIAFDSQGNRKWEKDLTEYGARSAQMRVTVDGEGRVYVFIPGGDVAWFDEQGNPLGQMQLEDTVMASGIGRNGKVYVAYYGKTGASVLAELDIERGEVAQIYEDFPNSLIHRLIPGTEQDFLVADWQGHLYGYNLESQTTEEIFSWMDYDISYLTVGGYWPAEDGGVTALLQSVSPGQVDLVRLERRDPASVPQKTEIVVAVLGDWGGLPREIAAFNRQSEDCHITYRQYHADSIDLSDAVTKLNIDLVSRDNCPDIIVLNSSINVEALAGNGVFEDLSVYLEQSDTLNREDYPENILDCFTFQEVLTGIPLTFSLRTVVGRGADLGDGSGWTLDEMIAYGEKHPDAKLFYDSDRYSMYYRLMTFGQSRFIDQQAGSCSFDSDEFKSLLSYIATYPEPDYNNYPSFSAKQIQNGEVLLHEIGISAYQDIQLYDGLFGGEAAFIGYPTPDGSNGCELYTFNAYGIVARSEKKDEAWQFIEFFLSEDPEVWGYSGLPSNTEDRLAGAVETQYVRDQFGRLWMGGTEGKPVEKYSTGVYSGMQYEYHPVTEEEIAELEDLVDTAQVVFSADAEISRVLNEETQAFFSGQRSVDDVAQIIQNRVQLFLNEN